MSILPRPGIITNPDNIPTELQNRLPWLLWKPVLRKDGRIAKIPVDWRNPFGDAVNEHDAAHQCTFDQAVAAMRADAEGRFGIGIVLTREAGVICFDEDEVTEKGREILTRLHTAAASYADGSVSGRGTHSYWFGTLPHGKAAVTSKPLGMQVYAHSQFIAMTGIPVPQGHPIAPLANGHLADGSTIFSEMFATVEATIPNIRIGAGRWPIAGIAELLTHIDAACDHRTWCNVVYGVWHETGGSQAGFDLVNDWSATGGQKYDGIKQMSKMWERAREGTTIGSVVRIAKENGADVSAIMRRHGVGQLDQSAATAMTFQGAGAPKVIEGEVAPAPVAKSDGVTPPPPPMEYLKILCARLGPEDILGDEKTSEIARILAECAATELEVNLILGTMKRNKVRGITRKLFDQLMDKFRTPEEDISEEVADATGLVLDKADPMSSARIYRDVCLANSVTWVYWRGMFYEWGGSRYVEISADAAFGRAWTFLDAAQVKVYNADGAHTGYRQFKPKKADVENFVSALKAVVGITDSDAPFWITPPPAFMPQGADIIVMQNGLFDIRSSVLYAHTANYFNLGATEYDYDASAPVPEQWLRFLGEALPNDAALISTLQEVFGYMMTVDTSQQKIFVFPGPPRAGKGTMLRTLEALLGSSNYTSITLGAFAETHGRKTLIGKLAAIIGDASVESRKALAASEALKSISGEDSANIPRKFLDDWIGHLTVRFIIAANEMPSLPDPSGALASRYIAIPFTQSFLGREDTTLSQRIKTEMSGIFNWAMEGLHRLKQRGKFVQPESGLADIGEAAASGSHAIGFVNDCCELATGATVATADLYVAYARWCQRNNQEALSSSWFLRRMKAAFGTKISACKIGPFGAQRTAYEGVKLLDQPGSNA